MPVDRSGNTWAFGTGYGAQGQDFQNAPPRGFMGMSAGEPGPQTGLRTEVGNVPSPKANYLVYLFVAIGLLVVLKFASEHEKTKMEPRIAGIGVYNFIVIGLMATLFLIMGKVIFNKYQVRGITDLFNAA